MKDKKPPRSIRLDTDVDAWVKDRAKDSDRSVNAEINRLLRQAKEADEQKAQAA
ncbi:MAG: hypothetical protein PHE17_09015 [Thiothrix sp.]|uniref:hypothetical protein n=1 Tax=Thiothrix sp. TaxID=1032 RepID=UPI0026257021|nr:hypothetical protein [Thiothrix sp.]MDD5393144.1 hypothetical protein [Thiothrix sp.]